MQVLRVVPLLTAAVLLAGCGGGSDVGREPGPSPSASGSASGPAAGGPPAPLPTYLVRTLDLVTVIDTGTGPEVCFGPVAESDPPQCTGPAVRHWRWESLHQGMYQQTGSVRWGEFELTGSWDGQAFTVDGAVPAPVYDPGEEPPTPTPAPATTYPADRLQGIADEVTRLLPGLTSARVDDTGHVLVQVVYDDGSLQRWTDRRYGRDVVLVSSELLQLGRA